MMISSRWGGNDSFSWILTTRLSGPLVLGLHAHSHVVCLAGKVAYFSNSPASDLSQAPSILKYFKHRGSTSGVRSRSLSCSRGSQHSLPLSDCLATKTPLPGTTEYIVDCFLEHSSISLSVQSQSCHVDCSQPSCVLSSWSQWSVISFNDISLF